MTDPFASEPPAEPGADNPGIGPDPSGEASPGGAEAGGGSDTDGTSDQDLSDPDGASWASEGAIATPDSASSAGVTAPSGEETAGNLESEFEVMTANVERLAAERDELRDRLQRTQAEFDNYRKRATRERDEAASAGASRLVEDLLPVLDACDGALSHGETAVEPVFTALLASLEKGGLERIDPLGEGFDPNLHEAVVHEPAEDGDEGEVVAEVMRRGYVWNGRVLRPAMVKVRG